MLYNCFWLHGHGGWILTRKEKVIANSNRTMSGKGRLLPACCKLPNGLLERRLMKAREEKGKLAAKVAELEARLKDAKAHLQR